MFIKKIKKIISIKFIKFFIVGSTGVLLNLIITAILQFFIFPKELFYMASIIGTTINVIYNFILHTFFTFKTKTKHKKRFFIYALYIIFISTTQELIIKTTTPLIGLNYLVIYKALIILIFSIITYFFFKIYLFNEKN